MRMRIFTALLVSAVACISSDAIAGEKLGERLARVLDTIGPDENVLVWVFLTDKGSHEAMKAAVPRNVVSERSIRRRLKVRAASNVVDYTDLPVEQSYVDQLAPHGLIVRQRSKWFNAVSGIITKEQIPELEKLPFLREIELVGRFKKNASEEETADKPYPPAQPDGGNVIDSADYGASYGQVNQINVPAVHNQGNYAQGVIVGVLDSGFRLLTHQAFDSMQIIATYDFVEHKVNVVPSDGSGAHGVNTLSTIGGYKPGQLIGPAFGATYVLARTENEATETPIEEDNWVAAIEWADSLGVEVTSTSLGYLDYDIPFTSWTWQDLNGNTTVITRAADMAVARGIVVLNSAGNSGFNADHNTLGAPADGDSVIAVGAVTSSGTRVSFSSVGPTTSNPPRIKPDVMAQGSSVRVASSSNPAGYGFSSGTSFSCPLAAGVAALIVHARPNATPAQIAGAMRNTASRASSPDNLYGWGIVNALAAINSITPSGVREVGPAPSSFRLEQNFPNPFNPSTTITFSIPVGTRHAVSLQVFDLLGQAVTTLIDDYMGAGTYRVTWDASELTSGVYFYRLTAGSFTDTKKLILLR